MTTSPAGRRTAKLQIIERVNAGLDAAVAKDAACVAADDHGCILVPSAH